MLFSFGLCVRVCFLNGRWFLRGWWVSVVGSIWVCVRELSVVNACRRGIN